jgi:hypothetical protein
MARVVRATANLKEAISKPEVLTNRNLIKGSQGRATEQWIGNARISTVTLGSKSGRTQGKFSILFREILYDAPTVQGGAVMLTDIVQEVSNIKEAYQQVKRNKGAAGVDQMTVGEFAPWYVEHGENLISQLYQGIYQPQMVRQVEIPKPQGGKPKLGIPTITDRVIQQGIAQVLSPICEKKFSDQSYGFRPGRNAHQALWKGSEYVKSGRDIVVDLDLKTFFDVVNPLNVSAITNHRRQKVAGVDTQISKKRDNG